VLTLRFRADSDLHFLVDFDPGHVPGLVTLPGLEMALSAVSSQPRETLPGIVAPPFSAVG
jgi:hypothetical protein